MKRKQSSPEIINPEETAILIAAWRKLTKLPIGPLDRLQTREFRSLVGAIGRLREEKVMSDRELIGAYLLYDWQLHRAQGLSLITEIPTPPRRVLEIGCGGAPFALAALERGATEVVGLDHNPDVLRVATEICGKLGHPISLRQYDCRSLNFPVEGKWDLIILGYSLYEISTNPVSYIQALLSKLSDNGFILIVEPSEQAHNKKFLALRDALSGAGVPIQAPCLWKGICPALRHGSSACYAQRPFEKPPLVKEIQRALQINLSSLKMSYLLLSKTPKPALERELYRVVSPPVETFKGERFFLCGNKGQRTLGSSLKEHPKHSKAFTFLKRGDVISVENGIERRDDLEVGMETVVRLEAPCDKPAPDV